MKIAVANPQKKKVASEPKEVAVSEKHLTEKEMPIGKTVINPKIASEPI
jgi:hypothetical protein